MPYETLHISKAQINAGAKSPFKLFHITDCHICLCDERNDLKKRELAENRNKAFASTQVKFYEGALDYAKANNLTIISTGDICDFVSYANFDYVKKSFEGIDYIFAVGNHEFSLYVGEAFEDEDYKMQSFDEVQNMHPDKNLRFDSRIINGVNIITLDNVYYNFTSFQTSSLEREIDKGLPIILAMHNPIHTDELYNYMMNEKQRPCAYLVGTPEKFLKCYPPDRYVQQRPDKETLEFIEFASKQPLIKGVIAGHLHFDYETVLPWNKGIPQICTCAGYYNAAREIEII